MATSLIQKLYEDFKQRGNFTIPPEFLPPENGFRAALKQLNWASYVLAFSLVGLELGFLLVYRAGWNLGIAAVLVNVVASLLLVPVALYVFKDRLSAVNIIGILVCLAGLLMLNWKR